ncbi:Uncharacterised protein [Vibrio cholerae]|nr:Uncharacterised protein [Vibrio cholerae]CSB87527.1 Uncharacterised protein [Vibrio cholerae]CSD68880.1 Uncharacterised protein [Vibrio cholerae]CSI55928.1 Uncharacterised protein [Vibrio cholerae]
MLTSSRCRHRVKLSHKAALFNVRIGFIIAQSARREIELLTISRKRIRNIFRSVVGQAPTLTTLDRENKNITKTISISRKSDRLAVR